MDMPFSACPTENDSKPDWNDDESTLAGSSSSSGACEWDGNTYGLQAIGYGTAGIVFALDDEKVVKVYVGSDNRSVEDFETERQAYINLGQGSRHVLKCLDVMNPDGLVLERCQETLRSRIKSRRGKYSPQEDALRYAIQAARGLTYVHSCGIIQGDGKYCSLICISQALIDLVGCHNMLLDRRGMLKIADFAGSSVINCRYSATVNYEVGSQLPGRAAPSVKSDIFAFGSALYEMINGRPPYKGKEYAEVQRRFRKGIFPNDFEPCSFLRHVVENCWETGTSSYSSMEEVYIDLCRLGGRSPNVLDLFKPASSRQKSLTTSYKETTPTSVRDPVDFPKIQQASLETRRRQGNTYVNHHFRKKRSKEHHKELDRDISQRNETRKPKVNNMTWLIDSFCSLTIPNKRSSGLQAPRHYA